MRFKKNNELSEVLEVSIDVYDDYRGENFEVYNKQVYLTIHNKEFCTDTMSYSRRNVLRGLHGDFKTSKLVQCLHGEVFLAVVDFRESSPTYLKHTTIILSSKKRNQVFIPAGFLNGHLCLTEDCIFSYKMDMPYNREQITVRYDSPIIGIVWPCSSPILSKRDM